MKKNKVLLITLFIFFIISIVSIYSARIYINDSNIVMKQIVFYLIGFFIIFVISRINKALFIKYSFYIYLIGNLLLLFVLLFGREINGAKAWFKVLGFGIQPSEFMKIGIILYNAKVISVHNKKTFNSFSDDLIIIIKIFIITLIPSILTFLEPDTGAVIIYFVISLAMLFVCNIKKYWFYILIGLIGVMLGGILYLYFYRQEVFINVLGSDFFYRMDRLFDWLNLEGMQLQNSLITIGSSGIIGKGFNNLLVYFPEPATDFIFASFVGCFGLIGGFVLIGLIIIFDIKIINVGIDSKKDVDKYIITGIIIALVYQQIQNIGMTIGLLPITGITLPFISYGGSSLISYMILLGIIININKKNRT